VVRVAGGHGLYCYSSFYQTGGIMTITELHENEDGSVQVQLDMTPEEHQQLLEAAIIRGLHLAIQEKKDIEKGYKDE
jgi:hypothetical protein